MTTRHQVLIGIVVLWLAGCSKQPPSIVGTWVGTHQSYSVTVTLTESTMSFSGVDSAGKSLDAEGEYTVEKQSGLIYDIDTGGDRVRLTLAADGESLIYEDGGESIDLKRQR